MTKKEFLSLYREELPKRYPWAQDATKLDHFMKVVAETVRGTSSGWNWDGPVTTYVWKQLGGKGKPTLKALRELL